MALADKLREHWRADFDHTLAVLADELGAVETNLLDVVVFGSASLAIRGIIDRSPGDVDAFVSKRVWGLLLNRNRWEWRTPGAGDPPMLTAKVLSREINLWFDWRDPWLEIDVPELISDGWKEENRVSYCGTTWPCAPVQEVIRHKRQAIEWPINPKRTLHLDDIGKAEAWLRG